MSDCIFCKIKEGAIPSTKIYETESLYAINDIAPQAPVHVLIIPKKHIARIENICVDDISLMGELVHAAKEIAIELGLEDGYRLVFNVGKDGQQSVEHIHLHLMGGRKFNWPAG